MEEEKVTYCKACSCTLLCNHQGIVSTVLLQWSRVALPHSLHCGGGGGGVSKANPLTMILSRETNHVGVTWCYSVGVTRCYSALGMYVFLCCCYLPWSIVADHHESTLSVFYLLLQSHDLLTPVRPTPKLVALCPNQLHERRDMPTLCAYTQKHMK